MHPIITRFIFLFLTFNSISCFSNENIISFKNSTSLKFSSPLSDEEKNNFGSGWKTAKYKNKYLETVNLFNMEALTPTGGVVFDDTYPPETSPSGKYVVILIQRVGIIGHGPTGTPEIQSREYCPVLDTSNGCILSNQTGELCGGEWKRQTDHWMIHGMTEDASAPMLHYEFYDANNIWKKFSEKNNKITKKTIQELISDNLGIENLLSCNPITDENVESYTKISRELKNTGNIIDSEIIENKITNRYRNRIPK